jgi:hypothetical protein
MTAKDVYQYTNQNSINSSYKVYGNDVTDEMQHYVLHTNASTPVIIMQE